MEPEEKIEKGNVNEIPKKENKNFEAPISKPTEEVKEEKPKPSVGEVPKESMPKKEEKRELTDKEKINTLAEKKFKEILDNKETWITITDPAKNFWNSGDYLHFYVSQGRCKRLPSEVSPILENALSKENALLREASEGEIRAETTILAEEELISLGEIRAKRFTEEQPLKL